MGWMSQEITRLCVYSSIQEPRENGKLVSEQIIPDLSQGQGDWHPLATLII
jgi:hypothetical protein